MPPWRGKSTYPSCSDFPNHLLLHPGLAKVYALKVSKLHEALDDPTYRAEASDALRGLVHRIVVTPNAGDTGSTAMLEGDLAELLWFAAGQTQNARAVERGRSTKVVAGVGFEPTTFRL